MTTQLHTKNLRLEADEAYVVLLDFGKHVFGLHTMDGQLSLHAPFSVKWDDGTRDTFDPADTVRSPIAHRLLDALLGVHIVRSVAGVERADLRIEFENGMEIELSVSNAAPQHWYARNFFGTQFVGKRTGELEWWGGTDDDVEPTDEYLVEAPPVIGLTPVGDDISDVAPVIDLEITDHIFGITVYGTSVQLETHGGSIYLAGPFTVIDSIGEEFDFDPTNLADDTVAGPLLAVLIDHRVKSYVLRPETSEFSVTLAGGGGLKWKASTPAQAQFSARLRNGREFWSKGDGTIYWYGGPEGTHPKFLVGGPKETD